MQDRQVQEIVTAINNLTTLIEYEDFGHELREQTEELQRQTKALENIASALRTIATRL